MGGWFSRNRSVKHQSDYRDSQRSYQTDRPRSYERNMNDATTRIKMCIEGDGQLEDGTYYTRDLHITEKAEFDGHSKEVFEERIEIDGDVCEIRGVRVDGVLQYEHVDDDRVRNGGVFEERWREVNFRWGRVLQFHIP